MATTGSLRRKKSLKDTTTQESQHRIAYNEQMLLPPRPTKRVFVQMHITSDDLKLHPSHARPAIPPRVSSHRNTWPTVTGESRPGSYRFDETPTLVKTPWEYERSRGSAIRRSRESDSRPDSPSSFDKLPREVLLCVLDQVKAIHSANVNLNISAYQRDLRALCMSDKQLHRVAREHLYRTLFLPSSQEFEKRGFSRRRHDSRLSLLLRTLRASPGIAEIVRRLHVTADLAYELEVDSSSLDVVFRKASSLHLLERIISVCPNLEHLTGCVLKPLVLSTRCLEALASCQKLKSHIWRLSDGMVNSGYDLRSGDLINCQAGWLQLETLVVAQSDRDYCFGLGTINGMIQRLPRLKHLFLKGLSAVDFHNGSLLLLPALKSLRLEQLQGITDHGLAQLAYARLAESMEKLVLEGLELTSLHTIQTLLATMSRLRSFTLYQNKSPEIKQRFNTTCSNFSLGSNTVRYLHWDVVTPGNSTAILANSIAAGHFPSLRTVKVPWDYDGAVQALCRPLERQPIDMEDLRLLDRERQYNGYTRNLRVAQIQTQLRIREHRKQPSFTVLVEDVEDDTQQTHIIGSYLGNTSSKLEYSLESWIPSSKFAISRIEHFAIPAKCRTGRSSVDSSMEEVLTPDMLF